jgi:hypothetical protein
MADTFFDQMGDMNALDMLLGIRTGLKGGGGANPLTFDTDPMKSIDRASNSLKLPGLGGGGGSSGNDGGFKQLSDPMGLGGAPMNGNVKLPTLGDVSDDNAGPRPLPPNPGAADPGKGFQLGSDMMGNGPNNPLANAARAASSLRMPAGPLAGLPGVPGGVGPMPPTISPDGQDPAASAAAGAPPMGPGGGIGSDYARSPQEWNMNATQTMVPASGNPTPPTLPGMFPGVAPNQGPQPMFGPGAPNLGPAPDVDPNMLKGPIAGLPPDAAPPTGPGGGPPLMPPAPRADALPPGMDQNGLLRTILNNPQVVNSLRGQGGSPFLQSLLSALGIDGSKGGQAGLGAGLLAGAGNNPGSKLGAFMRGAGGALQGRTTQKNTERPQDLADRKQDELEDHTRWQEQQGNIKSFYENAMQPLKAEHMTSTTNLNNARANSVTEGRGVSGRAPPWQSTPFGQMLQVDKTVDAKLESAMKTMRAQLKASGWTDQQIDARNSKLRDEYEGIRQKEYQKYGISPDQAGKLKTMGQQPNNPVDPFAMKLNRKQFDEMVPMGHWFIPKPGAKPIQRTVPPQTELQQQEKNRENQAIDDSLNTQNQGIMNEAA